jgi:hypothetical protein
MAIGFRNIKACKTHTLISHAVDVGCFKIYSSITTQVGIALVINEDDNNVRFLLFYIP